MKKHHRYLNILTASPGDFGDRSRVLTGIHLLTIQTMLMFLLALLYDLQGPADDGTCEAQYSESDCLHRKSVLDNTVSYTITKCKYFSVRNIVLNFHFNRDNFNIKSNKFCDVFLRTYKKIVVDESHFVSPVDGLLIQSSNIQNNCILINKQNVMATN